MKRYLLFLAALALSAPASLAGYLITGTQTDLSSGTQTETEMLVEGPNMRTKVDTGAGETEVIFLGREKKILNIMHANKQVLEMTGESMQAMSAGLDAAMQEMQKQMADMPPQQRAMMEKMMGGSMPKMTAPPKPTYSMEATGESEEVDGMKCRKYEMLKDGEKTVEILAAPWSQVGAGPDSVEALRAMSEFMKESLAKMKGPFASQINAQDFGDLSKVDGFPILIRNFKNGRVVSESRNAKPIKQDVPASTFEPPAGYEVVDPAAAMQGAF